MECRICLEEQFIKSPQTKSHNSNGGELLSPCMCSGTSKYVHRACLETWLDKCDSDQARKMCMECHTPYKFEEKINTKFYNIMSKMQTQSYEGGRFFLAISLFAATFLMFFRATKLDTYTDIIGIMVMNKTELMFMFIVWIGIVFIFHLIAVYITYLDSNATNYIREWWEHNNIIAILFYYAMMYTITRYLGLYIGIICIYVNALHVISLNYDLANNIQQRPVVLDIV